MADDELRVRASMDNELSRPLEQIREDVEDVRQEMDRTNRTALTTNRSMGTLGTGVGKLTRLLRTGLVAGLRMAGIAIAALGAAAVVGLGKVISLASDAAETMSKFNTVFGQNRREMEKWVRTVHGRFGIATKELRDAASTFGVFGQAAGIANKDLPGFSKSLVAAGLDLASFYNVSPEEAFLSLRSGLAGEAEPLRKFGIFLSEATLQAKAAQMGLRGEMTESQKVMVRQALILDGLGKAEGDLERTSGSLSNKWRALKGRVSELGTSIGTGLIPVATRLVSWLEGRLEPITRRLTRDAPLLADAFDRAFEEGDWQGVAEVTDHIAGNTGRLIPKIKRLVELGQAFSQGGFPQTLGAIKEQFPALEPLLTKAQEVTADLVTIWREGIKPAFEEVGAILPDVLSPLKVLDDLLGFVADHSEALVPLIGAAVAGFVAFKGATIAVNTAMAIGNGLRFLLTTTTSGLAAAQVAATTSTGTLAAGTGVLNAVMSVNPVVAVVTALTALAVGLVVAYKKSETFRRFVDALWQGIQTLWDWIVKVGGALAGFLIKWSPVMVAFRAGRWAVERLVGAFNWLRDRVGAVVDWIASKLDTLLGPLDEIIGKIGDVVGSATGGVGGRISDIIADQAGDTKASKARGSGGGLGSTLGIHGRLEAMTPGSRTITSAVRNWGASGDHQAGRALDLTGSNLNTYAQGVRSAGGFAEFHGRGKGRHLHAVYPAGDTKRPRSRALRLSSGSHSSSRAGIEIGELVHVENLYGADLESLEEVVVGALRRVQRDDEERS